MGKEEQSSSVKKTMKLRLVQIAVVIAAGVVLFTAGAVWHGQKFAATEPEITSSLLSQRLHAVSELATVEYYYTNMGKFENQVDFYGWHVPFTKKSFIISYDGVIKAGIDATKIETDVQGQEIIVTVPPAEILSHEIDDQSLEVFDETKNIFNQIEISDYTGFSTDQKLKIEERAVKNGLLSEAQEKAKDALEQLLRLAPDMDMYTITVHTKTDE